MCSFCNISEFTEFGMTNQCTKHHLKWFCSVKFCLCPLEPPGLGQFTPFLKVQSLETEYSTENSCLICLTVVLAWGHGRNSKAMATVNQGPAYTKSIYSLLRHLTQKWSRYYSANTKHRAATTENSYHLFLPL